VTVNPLPVPAVTGPASACVGVAGKTYTGQPGKINYTWSVPSQATVTGGGTGSDDFITVTWNSTGSYNVSLNYAEPATSCMAAAPTQYPVTVNALPVPTVSGPNSVCAGVSGKTYTTQAGKLNYVWNIPAEATVTAGGTGADNSVTVTWNSVGT